MSTIKNLSNNNVKVIESLGPYHVLEHQSDLSVNPMVAMVTYYAQRLNIKRRQLFVELNGTSVTVQSGAMQWMLGNLESTTGVKGVGDLFKKGIASKVTGESVIKPEYKGKGKLMLEPTYKHILLVNVGEWGAMVLQDGLFLACDSSVQMKVTTRNSISSAIAGGEGLFNLTLQGNGIAALESPVARDELIEFDLNNDVLKIDGSMAIAWSNSLNFTVERSSKSLIGSMVNGEGLVNVYRGTGKVLMTPTGESNGFLPYQSHATGQNGRGNIN